MKIFVLWLLKIVLIIVILYVLFIAVMACLLHFGVIDLAKRKILFEFSQLKYGENTWNATVIDTYPSAMWRFRFDWPYPEDVPNRNVRMIIKIRNVSDKPVNFVWPRLGGGRAIVGSHDEYVIYDGSVSEVERRLSGFCMDTQRLKRKTEMTFDVVIWVDRDIHFSKPITFEASRPM